jgi:hypothetical protein
MPHHKQHEQLIANIALRETTYIHGPTGSGKSQGVKEACKELNIPFYKKLVGNQTSEVSILGYMDAGGNYVKGIAYEPFVNGGVLLIDEVDNGNPNTNLVINGLSDGEIAFPCGMREKHQDFCLVATANTTGNGATLEYCGRNRIDQALLNRFVFIAWPYDEALEFEIGWNEWKRIKPDETDQSKFRGLLNDIIKFRAAINELKINHIISPRNTLQATRKLATGRPLKEIFYNVLFKGMDEDAVNKIKTKCKDSTIIKQSVCDEFNEFLTRFTEDDKQAMFKPLIEKQLEKDRERVMREYREELNKKEVEASKTRLTASEIRIKEMEQQLIEMQQKHDASKIRVDTSPYTKDDVGIPKVYDIKQNNKQEPPF